MSHGQTRVPEQLQRSLDERGDRRRCPRGVQEQEVHVGVGGELGAAIAPERHHRTAGELRLSGRSGLFGGSAADPLDHEVHLEAAGTGDLGAAEAKAVPHPEPLGLQADIASKAVEQL